MEVMELRRPRASLEARMGANLCSPRASVFSCPLHPPAMGGCRSRAATPAIGSHWALLACGLLRPATKAVVSSLTLHLEGRSVSASQGHDRRKRLNSVMHDSFLILRLA